MNALRQGRFDRRPAPLLPGGLCLALACLSALAQVGPPPVVVTQPLNQVAFVGAPATFAVTVVSGTNPTYKWRHNGSYISGANLSTYTILSTQATDAGTYSVDVRNAGGTVTSSNATLTVLALPLRITTPVVSSNFFQMQLSGPVGGTFVIETSTNLTTWIPVVTNVATTGTFAYTDRSITNRPQCYYRALLR